MFKQPKKFNLFSERVLVVLVSFVTLLLQLISFATTWDGAKVYLDGVFPYASLFFAIAIQATAYFFSNSLRKRKSVLKVVALCLAICCSTYYSYIGIYNSVNSPLSYMQERYAQISDSLTKQYNNQLEIRLSQIHSTISDTVSEIIKQHQLLCSDLEHANACLTALEDVENDISTGMRAPKQSAYESYEDYLAAYEAYITARSTGNNLELSASRDGILASYGFSDLEEVATEKSEITGTLTTLYTILNITSSDELGGALSELSSQLQGEIHNASLGISPTSNLQTDLSTLFQAASLLESTDISVAEIINTLNQCTDLSSSDFMPSYSEIAGDSPQLKDAMNIKSSLDSEILSALLKINTLFPAQAQIALTDDAYQITDLYLIPILSLTAEETKLTALFCLSMAGLVDGLSVIFAISLRGKKPLWNKRTLPVTPMDERYISQIYASLPPDDTYANGFRFFMQSFVPSPETEPQGYMLRAPLEELSHYGRLAALLCQINLAKIIREAGSGKEVLLLKAGFVFWVNDMIYQAKLEMEG